MYFFIWGLLGIVMLLCRNLLDSRQGAGDPQPRAAASPWWKASRSISSGCGLPIFVLAGLLAGLSGWLYAHMQRYVSPAPFDLRPGIELLLMALVGGAGHIAGAVVGAAIITLLKNVLQDVLPAFTRYSAQLEIVVFGVLFIVLLQKRARGIVPMISRYLPLPRTDSLPRQAVRFARRARPAVSGRPVLTIQGATKRFGALAAVNDVSFEVKSGEVLGLIGPNGAGKTTLLNLITGTAKPNAGRILFLDDDMTQIGATSYRRQRRCAHVPARETAPEHDAARQRPARNIFAHAIGVSRGRNPASTAQRSASAQVEALQQLKRVGLGEKAGELAGNLPLGQQRLLEVARALAADPVVVILDEPRRRLAPPREASSVRPAAHACAATA